MQAHIKLYAQDMDYDPITKDACRADVWEYCADEASSTKPYATHDCLFRHLDEISLECKRQEYRLESFKARDVQVRMIRNGMESEWNRREEKDWMRLGWTR